MTMGTASAVNVYFVPHQFNINAMADPLQDYFSVNLIIDPLGESVKGVQFEITFDSSVIVIDNVTEGNFLKRNGAASTFCVPTIINNTSGKISNLACTIISGPSVSASGYAATINGHLKTDGNIRQNFLLNITVAKVSDPEGAALAVTTYNGYFILIPEVLTLASNSNRQNCGKDQQFNLHNPFRAFNVSIWNRCDHKWRLKNMLVQQNSIQTNVAKVRSAEFINGSNQE